MVSEVVTIVVGNVVEYVEYETVGGVYMLVETDVGVIDWAVVGEVVDSVLYVVVGCWVVRLGEGVILVKVVDIEGVKVDVASVVGVVDLLGIVVGVIVEVEYVDQLVLGVLGDSGFELVGMMDIEGDKLGVNDIVVPVVGVDGV